MTKCEKEYEAIVNKDDDFRKALLTWKALRTSGKATDRQMALANIGIVIAMLTVDHDVPAERACSAADAIVDTMGLLGIKKNEYPDLVAWVVQGMPDQTNEQTRQAILAEIAREEQDSRS